jgi:di/tricarboxylate transporter
MGVSPDFCAYRRLRHWHYSGTRRFEIGSDTMHAATIVTPAATAPLSSRVRLPLRTLAAAAVGSSFAATIWFGLPMLPESAREALIVFVLAIVGWTVLRLPETSVAIGAALALVVSGAIEPDAFYQGLGDDLVWLLIGAFMVAAVLARTGLAERVVLRAVATSRSPRALFHRLNLAVIATAFVIPSTSARAALLVPVFLVLAGAIDDRRIVHALALLFPSTILLSACASLLGAGAHLVAVEFMTAAGLPRLSFAAWALLGAPFAILSCVLATELVLVLFVGRKLRRTELALPAPAAGGLTASQRAICAITLAMVVLWSSANWHGIEPAFVALAGALLATTRALTGIGFKEALRSVEWGLVLFLAATLVLGESLMSTGAAQWLAQSALTLLPAAVRAEPAFTIAIAAAISMVSHLVITSRSARAAVLIPTLALPLAIAPQHAAVLILVAAIGSGFCQTLKVSAKPVALFGGLEAPTFGDGDLLRLALWLMPAFALLLVGFGLFVWPHYGF